MRIVEERPEQLAEYETVPIGFWVRSRMDLDALADLGYTAVPPAQSSGGSTSPSYRVDDRRWACPGDAGLLPAFMETPVEPWWKDYDAYPGCRPTDLMDRFDLRNWGIFAAFESGRRVGGMIVARSCPSCDMLEGRDDLVVPFDVRVHPEFRGHGVGRALWELTVDWAREHKCIELRVETQDINVPACRFYRAMGCRVLSVQPGAYPDLPDEAMILWSRAV